MARSSSTSRAARLAQRSGRTRVRFQGGTLFPAIVAIVLVLGLASIVYARQSRPTADDSPPTVDDHWHASYGFYVCDAESGEMSWKFLSGDQEIRNEAGDVIDLQPKYQATGVHSHDDSIIHWHAFSSRATGKNAQLGVFLDVYDVELSDDELDFPDNQNDGAEYKEDDTECGDDDGALRVQVWGSYQDTGEGRTYTSGFDDIPITKNSMVFAIAFGPDDVEIPMPPDAARLPELGAVDAGSTEDPTATTVAGTGPTTVPASGATTVPGGTATTTAGTGTTTPATGATTPATTAPPSTAPATTASS